MTPVKEFKKDKLLVKCYDSRANMGAAAAEDVAAKIKEMLKDKDELNIIFAAAPSQNEVLAALVADKSIPWEKINAYHMDEYIGLKSDAPQAFGQFLKDHIFKKVPFKSVNCLNGECNDPKAECERYGKLLDEHPVDIVCLGIGENGHIAFNDPPVADFGDKVNVKIAELDSICRNQQVHDGCFQSLDEVPTHALTLTIPALTRAKAMFCVVPAATKADAVQTVLTSDKVGEFCPATILREHESAVLYLDPDSASKL